MQNQVTTPKSGRGKTLALIFGGIGCLALFVLLIAVLGGGYYYFNEQARENERYAIYGLQNIAAAQRTFMLRNGRYGNIDELQSSGQLNGYGHDLEGGSHGYHLMLEASGLTYRAHATPKSYGIFDGYRSFYLGSDGVIHGGDKRGMYASPSDLPAY